MKPYYQDSHCTIYHGDCREISAALKDFDLVLTDPPYGLQMNAGWACLVDYARYKSWDHSTISDLRSLVARGRHQIVWGGNYYPFPPARCWLTWFKPDAVPSMANFEMAWTNFDRCARQFSWSIAATNKERNGHPTQKPLALMSWCLSLVPDAETIFDPFMGSGTTLRAAKDLGKASIGIELDERFCELAALRLSQEVLAL